MLNQKEDHSKGLYKQGGRQPKAKEPVVNRMTKTPAAIERFIASKNDFIERKKEKDNRQSKQGIGLPEYINESHFTHPHRTEYVLKQQEKYFRESPEPISSIHCLGICRGIPCRIDSQN